MKTKLVLLIVGIQLAIVCQSRGAFIFVCVSSSFTYPPGSSLVGQLDSNGLTWEAAGPAGAPITIAAGNLVVPNLTPPEGNRARLAGVNGPAARLGLGANITTGTLYYSLALRVTDLGTLGTNGGTLAAFNNATGTSSNLPAPLAARLLIRSGAGGYQLGISANSGNTEDFWWWIGWFQPNETVFVTASYTFEAGPGNDTVRLWINPSAASFGASNAPPPTLTATAGTDINQLSSFVLMQRPQPILPAVTSVDEVRVGTTWASVTPVPLPTVFGGLPHVLLGNASVAVSSNGLQVANLGSSGQDGVRINLDRVDAWRTELTHQLGASNRADGSRIEWTVWGEKNGQPNQPVIQGRLERAQDCVALFADGGPVGASAFNFEVLSNGVVVASTTVNSGRLAALRPGLGSVIGPAGVIHIAWQGLRGPDDNWCYLSWARLLEFTDNPASEACDVVYDDPVDPGRDPIVIRGADTLRIRPVSMTATVGTFSRVELRSVNSGDFRLRDEAVGLFGLWHRFLGNAIFEGIGTGSEPWNFRIRNIGSSGQDGIETIAGGSEIWDLGNEVRLRKRVVKEFPDNTAPGFTLPGLGKFTATGRVQGSVNSFETLSDFTCLRQEQGTASELTASFAAILGVTHVAVDVFDRGAPVGIVTLPVGRLGTFSSTGRVSSLGFFLSPTQDCWRLRTQGAATFTPVTGEPLTGTFFRFGAVNPQATVVGLRSLSTRAANTGSFTLGNAFSGSPPAPRLGLNIPPGSAPRLMVPTDSHAIYRIEASTLVNGPWRPLGMIGGTGSDVEFTDLTGPMPAVRFYRVRGD